MAVAGVEDRVGVAGEVLPKAIQQLAVKHGPNRRGMAGRIVVVEQAREVLVDVVSGSLVLPRRSVRTGVCVQRCMPSHPAIAAIAIAIAAARSACGIATAIRAAARAAAVAATLIEDLGVGVALPDGAKMADPHELGAGVDSAGEHRSRNAVEKHRGLSLIKAGVKRAEDRLLVGVDEGLADAAAKRGPLQAGDSVVRSATAIALR